MKRVQVGDRVELHPGLDLWMRGAKLGVVRKVGTDPKCGDFVTVRLDAVKKLQHLSVDRVRVIEHGRGHHYGHCDGRPCTCGMTEGGDES